jgi:hypothetical protein
MAEGSPVHRGDDGEGDRLSISSAPQGVRAALAKQDPQLQFSLNYFGEAANLLNTARTHATRAPGN